MYVGKNGRKIPLDPATELPHDCPMRENTTRILEHRVPAAEVMRVQEEEKKSFDEVADQIRNDHGNETVYDMSRPKPTSTPKQEFVDHTVGTKGLSKVKIFSNETKADTENEYNKFLADNKDKIKTQGAHDHVTNQGEQEPLEFTIYLYYEEVTT